MKQEDWTKKLRERLSDYEQPAPADAWEQIERRLPASVPPVRTALHRWLAAAAAVLLLGGAGLVYYQSATEKPSAIQPNPVAGIVKKKPETMNLPAQPPTASQVQPTRHRPAAVAKPANSLAEPGTVATETTADSANAAPSPETPPTAVTMQPRHTGESAQRPQVTMPSPPKRPRQKDHNLGFGLLAMNTMAGSSNETNGVLMSNQMQQSFNDAYTAYKGNRRAAPVYLTDYEERATHKMPLRFGLTVNYRLGKNWQIETGVVYTHTQSEFVKQMRRNSVTTEQTLHYVGIPLRVGFTVWEWNRLRVYASGGGEVDFNVKAQRETEGIKQDMQHDRTQFSVQAAAGAQLNIIPQAGIYVEPGVTWYPNNGSQVDNVFKDRPLQPTLQFGLRYTVK